VILVDLNVILDVVQRREPHYEASAGLLAAVARGEIAAFVAAHTVTTIRFIVHRHRDRKAADAAVDWLLRHFDVAPVGRAELLQARALGWRDFEDAVVAAVADSMGCRHILTRNVKDFHASPVPASTPEEYLLDPGSGPSRIHDG
jgi:predicted nucleic acid-binding protein